MMVLFYALLIIFGLLLKKSRLYSTFAVIFIGIMVYLGENVADMNNYIIIYDLIKSGNSTDGIGIGWILLNRLSILCGFNYLQCKTIISVVFMFLFILLIRYYTRGKEYEPLIVSLFLIFPAFLDFIQIRFFIAEIIVLYAVKFLLNEKKWNSIKYIIAVLIASLFHSSAIIYLIFLLNKFINKNKEIYLIIISAFTIICSLNVDKIIYLLSSIIKSERLLNRYFYNATAAGMKDILLNVFVILLFYYISKKILDKINNMDFADNEKSFFIFFNKINLLIAPILILSLVDISFFRVQRILWILMYIALIKLLNYGIKYISICKIKVPVKALAILIAIFGNLFYISITMPWVMTDFLILN